MATAAVAQSCERIGRFTDKHSARHWIFSTGIAMQCTAPYGKTANDRIASMIGNDRDIRKVDVWDISVGEIGHVDW